MIRRLINRDKKKPEKKVSKVAAYFLLAFCCWKALEGVWRNIFNTGKPYDSVHVPEGLVKMSPEIRVD